MTQNLVRPTVLTDPLEILIKGCRENDSASQEKLYKSCYSSMISICYRYAGDTDGAGLIFNNAMLRVFKGIQDYQHEGKLMAWIKRIVINSCLDHVKKENRFREMQLGSWVEDVSIPPEVWDKVSVKDIHRMIRELPKATATVFNLFIYEGFTHRQISEQLGISEGTSKWHVNEGRKVLKGKLESYLTIELKVK